jgi:DNA-binding MarR family transcriptional regulator
MIIVSAKDDEERATAHFAHFLIQISDLMNGRVTDLIAKPEGLKNVDVRILLSLGPGEPASIGDISRRTCLDRAWISRTAHSLRDKGLLQIEAGHQHPASKLLSLTNEGEAVRSRVAPRLYEQWTMATAGINTKLAAQMLELVFNSIMDSEGR